MPEQLTRETGGVAPKPANADPELSFPAAIAQQAFYFFDRVKPGNPAFNVAVRFHLSGRLNTHVLERTFNELIRRHEILRTRFEEDADEVMQIVLPSVEVTLEVIDISRIPEAERECEIDRLGGIEAHKPFDLNKAPLIRASILQVGSDDNILQLTVHHAVSDGWSVGVIVEEIAAIYEAFVKGEPCPLPPLPIQFADFTVWQSEGMDRPEIRQQRDYWRNQLDGLSELTLPNDRPRPAVKSWEGDLVSVLLPEDLTARLQRIGQENGATLFMVFLATFKLLVSRYTGSADIAVGSPVAGRTRAELENLIGVFINTVIFRTDLSGNPTFVEVLRDVRETVLEALANQDLPFEIVVKDCHPARELGRNPLFQVNFIHQRDFVKRVSFGGLTLTAMPSRTPGAIFDLNFFMVERNGVWRASCDFNTDLFDRDTALRMLGHFRQLLVSGAATPEARIAELPMLTREEGRCLLVEWNRTARDIPQSCTVVSMFDEQVRLCPEKVAVRCEDQSLTYAELDQEASILAAELQRLGVKPDTLVGLCSERTIQMVVGILGVLKSGGAYVPMDPGFPAERLRYMIEDAAMPVIVTQQSLLDILPAHDARVLLMDERRPDARSALDGVPAGPSDLAYVIFTSGSTGRPKGVQIPHRSVVNFLNSMRREPGFSKEDVLLAVTTLSFDIATLELFLPLVTGGTVTVAPKTVVNDPKLLARELEQCGATVMQATPVTWRMLLESGWTGNNRLKALIGGEAVPPDLIKLLSRQCASLWNMYGPTETTVWSTVAQLEPGSGPVSIGRPIDNTQVYVASPAMQPQPVGVPGELLIGGDGLARGYLNRADLTSDKFIQNPFSSRSDERVYRTGDLARWHADGTLECLGRSDQQIKIRGFRIELGEIEAHLSSHPAVHRAVVVAREDTPGEQRLVAYVVPDQRFVLNPSKLSEFLRTKLPDYMLPAGFVSLEGLPLTPNGKIDRKALPAPEANGILAGRHEPVPLDNATEERVAAIFADVCQAETVWADDSFFDLGGHSLSAVRLMNEIEREFGVQLPLAILFDSPTVRQIAAVLTAPRDLDEPWDSLVAIRANGQGPELFLVHGAAGNVLLYRELAHHLPSEISVYGFQSQGLDGRGEARGTVEEMAEHYVSELVKYRSAGPYWLGGYCMGGIVAYEMARQLRSRGSEVRMVAMLDTYNLSAVRKPSEWHALWQKFVFHLENLQQLNAGEWKPYLGEKFLMIVNSAHQVVAIAMRRLRGGKDRVVNSPQSWASIQDINHKAGWNYKPGSYEGKVVLFKPKKNYDFYPEPKMGWEECVVGPLETVGLSVGPHAMLVGPFARELAEELQKQMLTVPDG